MSLFVVGALGVSGCASWRPASHETRRAEESAEQAAVVPSAPLPPVVAPPPPIRRVAKEWPSESIPGPEARTLAELVATTDPAPAQREVVRAIALPFAPGEITLGAKARDLLNRFSARLNLNDALFSLEVQGHADASGTESANIALGLKRAEAVRSYLLAATTIPSGRIAVVSLGSGRPVADNSSAEGRAANRRVLVIALR